MFFSFNSLAYKISAKSRARKHAFFLATIEPKPHESILDVGANAIEYSDTDNYLEKHYAYPAQITVVSLDDTSNLKTQYPEVTFIQADGTKLPFKDTEFDIAYSNAVIEHVGSYDAQRAFLSELARVSKRGYLTTPNRHFPIEVHTRVPLLHLLLPKVLFDAFLKLIGKGWAAENYMHLLTKSDLKKLLSDTGITHYHITHNRFCGLTMTYTLTWTK
ncbi:MAG: class I SAM-dependent methyltransferase [Candidatus Moranbacteria bacterium]|nr:class I SAM-dependent methyltransferase [Candidatus Moranbacteria bacterium]